MGCSRSELFERFDSQELAAWQVYFEIEPWGWKQDNLRFGTLATLLCPKSTETLAGHENWFTDELPPVSLYDDDEAE